MEPIVIQEVLLDKKSFPRKGEGFKFYGKVYPVICSQLVLKLKKLYFTNIWLDPTPIPGLK